MAVAGEDLVFLKNVLPFWEKLTEEQKLSLSNSAAPRRYHRGESMQNTSAQCAGLFLVKHGQLRIFIISENGKEITLYRLFDNDICIFSASCIMKNINFQIYVEAEQKTEVLLIPTSVYNQLNQTSLPVLDYTNQLMASRFSDVMWVMEQVLFTSFDKRLAHFLLEQSTIDGFDNLTITHEAIAKHMGSAREVVTRMLKYFQDEGMVKLARGEITLTDRKKLENLDCK
jgi:CRP/FNR family transcriptional regulator, anaerobic regulatory protein